MVNSLDVLRLVQQSKCSAYDCEFVALARSLNVPLITMDKQILKDFPTTAKPL
jgi:predicted nucleic acid-binding protein